jgi:putative oxidoreductase
MSDFADRVAAATTDITLLLGRLAMAAIFVPSGFNKLVSLDRFSASLANRGVAFAYALAIVGASVELFGSICIAIGFKTRYVALLMGVFTIAAAVISHRFWDVPDAASAQQYTQFMKNTAIFGGFLLLFAAGPGRYSVDRYGK